VIDALIFLFGCIVSLFVIAAVGLLMWAAADSSDERPRTAEAEAEEARRAQRRLTPAPVRVRTAGRRGERWEARPWEPYN